MQTEKNLPASLDDVVQWPCITPSEECGLNVDIIERSGDVSDDPLLSVNITNEYEVAAGENLRR